MEAQEPVNRKQTDPVRGVVQKTGEFLCEFLQLTGRVAENLTGWSLVRTGKVLRDKLDMVVEAGVARTRSEALTFLAESGLQAKQGILDKVEKARAEIEALKQGLKQSLNL
jgi:hypothetical protein